MTPEYYGLMMFAQAVPPGSRLVTTSTKNAAGIHAWATLGTDDHIRIVLTNESSHQREVKVRAGGVSATLERLRRQASAPRDGYSSEAGASAPGPPPATSPAEQAPPDCGRRAPPTS